MSTSKKTLFLAALLPLAASTLLASTPAYAGLKIYSPHVEEGMLELESRNEFYEDDEASKDGKRVHKLAVGYGVTDWWATEVYGELEKHAGPGEDYGYEATEWDNIFQFTQPGEYWMDWGGRLEYVHKRASRKADKVEAALLMLKEYERVETVANINLEKQIGGGRADGTELAIGISSRYLLDPMFEPGFEYHNEMGRISDMQDYASQKHRFGPAVYGSLGHGFSYEAGVFFGISNAAEDVGGKLYLEYEFLL